VALSQARNQYEVAQRQLEDRKRLGQKQALKSASGQLAAAKGKYLAAQAALHYSEIRSPIDGVVTDRPQFAGELATANQPLMTVMNISKLIAKLHIAQTEAATLKAGVPAEISVTGLAEAVPAHVTLVSPALDPGSTTVEVWIESLRPNSALKPGISVHVALTANTVKDALVVPAAAVFKNSEGADFVMLAGRDDKAHLKTVKVGIRSASVAQIVDGVKDGDRVVSSGGYALPDGTAIKVEEAAAPEKDDADTASDAAGQKKGSGTATAPARKEQE
jgi:HlyD family secretion protein